MSRSRCVHLAGFSSLCLLCVFYVISRYQVDLATLYQGSLDYMDQDKTMETSIWGNNQKILYNFGEKVTKENHYNIRESKYESMKTNSVMKTRPAEQVVKEENITAASDVQTKEIVINKNSSLLLEDLPKSISSESPSPLPNTTLAPCPLIPDHLVGRLKVLLDVREWEEMENDLTHISSGGEYYPSDCQAKDNVAIIVPYRARESQLRVFLNYLHPVLSRQNIHYRVFVISQEDQLTFNRAMLFNVGFKEASQLSAWDCFIFHDVDLLPEDDRNLYTCPASPRHMSVAVDKFKYRLPYKDIFGGVSALSTKHFELVNGFSNQYWGWGGEDDDMSSRVRDNKLKISRYKPEIARYTMIKHTGEDDNKPNPKRFQMLKDSQRFQKTDGLNNLKYNLLNLTIFPLYTLVRVEITHLNYTMEKKKKVNR